MVSACSAENFSAMNLWKALLFLGLIISLFFVFTSDTNPNFLSKDFQSGSKKWQLIGEPFAPAGRSSQQTLSNESPTGIHHIIFGILGSENAYHHRKGYIESWWRPNVTRGLLYLDKSPTGDLLPWSESSPPYKVSDDLTAFLAETHARAPPMIRMVHGIMEVLRDVDDENARWVVMGDDDSIFFVENMVDVLGTYDHRRYYYLGGQSEFILSNFWYAFNQAFGGAGIVMSYPLAKTLAKGIDSCLRRYAQLITADLITMTCIADIGVNLSPQQGLHQIDFRGDLSGFLSYHPKVPLMSLHHFDSGEPIFPSKNQIESTRHLMKAANADQSRLLQQTVCYNRLNEWTLSVSWGYSAHIYEKILPRSYLQNPIETFKHWVGEPQPPPIYMFNTRLPEPNDPCLAPHVFFFREVLMEKNSTEILTQYSRAAPRGLPECGLSPNRTADFISEIHVSSPAKKRPQMDRSECCDITHINGSLVEIHLRECFMDEIIA